MKTVVRVFGPMALVVALVTAGSLASDWLTAWHDPANTGNTVNTPAEWSKSLNVLWSAPAGGGSDGATPLVYGKLVVSGNFVYDSLTGHLVGNLPEAGMWNAITESGILMTFTGSAYCLYDLNSPPTSGPWPLLQRLVATLGVSYATTVNAKGDAFYVIGLAGGYDGVAKIAKMENGSWAQQWQKLSRDWGVSESPIDICNGVAVGAVDFGISELPDIHDVVYVGFADYYGVKSCIVALDAGTGEKLWSAPGFDNGALSAPTFDELNQLVIAMCSADTLRAYDAVDGHEVWTSPSYSGFILNGPPTLGDVWHVAVGSEVGHNHAAVFIVTGGADNMTAVHAFDRSNGEWLWSSNPTLIPCDSYVSAIYTATESAEPAGNLYIGAMDGLTYVLNANDGTLSDVIETTGQVSAPQSARVIVEVNAGDSGNHGVMYYLTDYSDGVIPMIEAWSDIGDVPQTTVFSLSAAVSPPKIKINSSATVTATFEGGTGKAIVGALVTFSCNAAKTQGYLSPTTDVTDASGVAHTRFISKSRTGVITIVPAATGATAVTNASVTVTK